jgi:hypothetical protein
LLAAVVVVTVAAAAAAQAGIVVRFLVKILAVAHPQKARFLRLLERPTQ